ncbi:MAG: hypothetical protein HC796_01555 [Synechococcaceae cyanobacterium RL_1_2]|nr:hypothetical protein [Synechococcaceae cyanobacterium RL_1_2]
MVANYFGPGDSSFLLKAIAVAVSACLGLYAIIQARSMDSDGNYGNDWWVYIGLVELAGTVLYGRLIWNNLGLLDPWRVVIVCGVALFIYQLPWQSWGWRVDPWHRTAIAIPALSILTGTAETSYLSLFAVALYYGRLAYTQQNIRWSYLSVGFVDWALFNWWGAQGLVSPVFYSSVLGLSLLYIAQFDTAFTQSQQRSTRHNLRTIAMVIICVPALLFEQDYGGIVPIAIGLIATLVGLGLQIRALLFVGTTTFILAASYQLLIVFLDYAFLKWVMGLMLGITIIFVAANFERSREQIILFMENWLDRLQQWQ